MESVYLNGGMIGVTLDFANTDQYIIGTTSGYATLEYVGGTTRSIFGSTGNINVDISGISMQENDLVIIAFATGSTADRAITASGYTQVAKLYANDTYDTNLYVGYKFMGSTPDTVITLPGGTLNSADAGTVAVHVWRNVDTTTPLDVTSTTDTNTNTVIPSPPAITPVTSGAVVIAAYAGAHSGGTVAFPSSNGLDNFLTIGQNDTNDSSIGLGSYNWTSGSYTPPTPSVLGNSSQWSSAAVTLALRPAETNVPVYGNQKNSGIWALQSVYDKLYTPPVFPEFISSSYGNDTSNDDITVTAPTGIQDGDLLVAYGFTNDLSTTITPPSGWTLDADDEHSFVASKIASSESGNYTFTWLSTAFNVGIAICVYRNVNTVSVGTFENFGTTTNSTAPSITAQAGIVMACYGMTFQPTTSSTITDYTRRVTTTNAISVAIYDNVNVLAGATGDKSITWSSGDERSSVLINLYQS